MSLPDKKMSLEENSMFEPRSGEIALDEDPALKAGDAHVVFIGTIHSAWTRRDDCPKNMREARETRQPGVGRDRAGFPARAGRAGRCQPCRGADLASPGAAQSDCAETAPCRLDRKAFSRCARRRVPTRSACMSRASLDIDAHIGNAALDAIDALDGTPVIDIKPYFASDRRRSGRDLRGQAGATGTRPDDVHATAKSDRQGA